MNKLSVGLFLAVLLIGVSAVSVLAAPPTVTVTVAIWATVPNPPTNFEITQTAVQNITLTWKRVLLLI